MGFIVQKIKQYKKRLKFALYCFPKGDDERFVRNVRNLGKENNLVYVESYGEENNEGAVYHIKTEYSGSGFFADHNRLLAFLYFADKFGLTPGVEYPQDYCYAEKHPVNGTNNPFEYYFQQPGEITLEQVYQCKRVIRSRKENISYAIALNEDGNGYSRSERYIQEMGKITEKYLKLSPKVEEIVYDGIRKRFSSVEKILGIHLRGTDFQHNYKGHPVSLTSEDYLPHIEQMLDKGYTRIFLATDDSRALGRLKSLYRDKIVYFEEVIRSDELETVMNSKNSRPDHHYQLGLEVLRDMFALAECDGLIAGLSQVSIAARIQKAGWKKEYDDLIIISKGINYHRKCNCPNV